MLIEQYGNERIVPLYARTGEGYCIFNDCAVAARYAQRRHGVRRVVVVDLDVHQGNGTPRPSPRPPPKNTHSVCRKSVSRTANRNTSFAGVPTLGGRVSSTIVIDRTCRRASHLPV